MKTTTKVEFTSKRGITINAGERVTITFNVKGKLGGFLPNYIRLTTEDGRSVVTKRFRGAGLSVPSTKRLEHWVCDSVCDSVFGDQVEPDGWDSEGSPSWLLVLGLI